MSKTFNKLMERKKAQLQLVMAALEEALLLDTQEIPHLTDYEMQLYEGLTAALSTVHRGFGYAQEFVEDAPERNKKAEERAFRMDTRIIDLGDDDDGNVQEDDRSEDAGSGQNPSSTPGA